VDQDLFKHIDAIFQLQFLPIGKAKVSLWMLIYIGVLVTSLIVVTNRLRDWTEKTHLLILQSMLACAKESLLSLAML
jgi:uncharacterized membrane protein YhaH (DUF805 family)